MSNQVLFVDDHAGVSELISRAFRPIGHAATPAASGGVAVELSAIDSPERRHFGIVLSDTALRRLDSSDVMTIAPNRPDPPEVIFLIVNAALVLPRTPSSRMSRPLSERLPEHQVSGQGPEHAREPASRPAAPARDLCVGSLRVDTYRHEVWFDGHRVHVTPTEFAILAHLAARPEQVVGYGDLARHTHGEDLAWNEADARDVLRYHIRNLRRKIDRRYLASVRGAGYMLDPRGTAPPPTGSGDGD